MNRPRLPSWMAGVMLVVAIGATYANGLRGPFVFDDNDSIVVNPTIRSVFPLRGVLSPPGGGVTVTGRPLLNLSFAANYAGARLAPPAYHLTNVVIHALAALLLLGIVRRTLTLAGSARPDLVAFVATLIWALHPLQTESVTYTVQRAESLMGLFYLLTLYAYIRGVDARPAFAPLRAAKQAELEGGTVPAPSAPGLSLGSVGSGRSPWTASRSVDPNTSSSALRSDLIGLQSPAASGLASTGVRSQSRTAVFWFGLAVIACLLGCGIKEVIVSAPLVAVVWEMAVVGGSIGDVVRRRRGVLAGFVGCWILLGWLVVRGGDRGGTAGFGTWVPAWMYWITQGPAVGKYLWRALWPHPLVFDYGYDRYWIAHRAAGAAAGIVAVAAAIVCIVAAFRRGPRRWLGMLGVFFFAILAPTAVIPGTRQTMAEHRMYLALIPVAVLAALGLWRLIGRRRPDLFLVLGAGGAGAFAVLSAARNRDYRSELALWAGTVAAVPDNPFALSSYGSALVAAGKTAAAVGQFQRAIAINPYYPKARADLGAALVLQGRADEGVRELRAALASAGDSAEIHRVAGGVFALAGRFAEANQQFAEAIRLQPFFPQAQADWGNACMAAGEWAQARDHYQAALAQRPDLVDALGNLGNAYAQLGRMDESVAALRAATQLRPASGELHNNLAITYAQMRRFSEAAAEFQIAIRCDPTAAELHNNYANVLKSLGRPGEARKEYDEALRLKPDYEDARRNREELPPSP